MPDLDLTTSSSFHPLVTVAIPTYNRAALLRRCVSSALAQSYSNYEVLVCDNASTDDTADMLRQFDNPRLRVIRHEANIGLLPNWNACVTHARGDYVVVLSDDDTIRPWMLRRCIALAAGRPEAAVIMGLSDLYVGQTGQTIAARTSPHLQAGIHDGTAILLAYLRDEIGVIATCSVMMRTEAIRAAGGFPLAYPYTADVAAWAPLLLMGPAGLVNEACATWYSHGGSETARLHVERLLSDVWSAAELISRHAQHHIQDAALLRHIRFHARRCFANRGWVVLGEHRRKGGSLKESLALLWRHWHRLRDAAPRSALRFAAISFCPRAIEQRARQLKQVISEPRRRNAPTAQAP